MRRDVVLPPLQSSFLSCDKDIELILNKLFSESPYSRLLKRLLIINTPDCLNQNIIKYDDIVKTFTVKDLFDKSYIRLTPRLEFDEHNDVQSYILISFDNFVTNSANEQFRDNMVTFDIVCNTKQWNLEGFKIRPLMIAGYIDGILNMTKLSGIGEFVFLGAQELILDANLAGYSLSYEAVHFSEDKEKMEDLI